MDSSSPKKKSEFTLAADNTQSGEREQGLSRNFDDPVLEELIPGLTVAQEPQGVVQETVEAVEDLLKEARDDIADSGTREVSPITELPFDVFELSPDGELPVPLAPPPGRRPAAPAATEPHEESVMFTVDSPAQGAGLEVARIEMAEKLFQLVACEKTFDHLAEALLAAIMNAIGAHAGSVLELDQKRQEYFFRSSIGGGDPEQVKAFRIPGGKGIVGHVAESRQPILLTDMGSDEKQLRAISMSVGFETKTCLAAPLIVGNQLYGVIELFNRKDGGVFEERDLHAFVEGVRMAGKVLEVRFLMAELVKRKR